MRSFEQRKREYQQSVEQAMGWICANQQADGGFGAVETMSHYMLVGASLLYCGRAEEAARLMPYLERHFVKPDGSFDPPEIRAGRQTALVERGYAPGWMIYSAHVNLAVGVSLRAMPHLLRLQDSSTGGMFGKLEDAQAGKGIINSAVTSVACEAALTTGYLREARRMADHLADNVIGHNPDWSTAFYPVWDTERGLRTDEEAPAGPNMPRVLLRGAANQGHFLTGMILGVLTDVYRVTRERKYLDAALKVYEFGAGCAPAINESTASHKFAWGAAWLYRETGNVEHLEAACRVADYLVKIQEADGSFVHWAYVKSADEWPYSPRLNITAQFALWICRVMHLV